MSVLLDTHVLLWWRSSGDRLSKTAASRIASSPVVWLSPITFWEVATLVRRARVALDRPLARWITDITAEDRVSVAELTPEIAADAGSLADAFPGDPADRLIYATARQLDLALVSRDDRLRQYASGARDVRIVW